MSEEATPTKTEMVFNLTDKTRDSVLKYLKLTGLTQEEFLENLIDIYQAEIIEEMIDQETADPVLKHEFVLKVNLALYSEGDLEGIGGIIKDKSYEFPMPDIGKDFADFAREKAAEAQAIIDKMEKPFREAQDDERAMEASKEVLERRGIEVEEDSNVGEPEGTDVGQEPTE